MCLKYSLPLALLFSLVVAPGMAADDYARVVPLFDGTKNIVGESLAYPTTGSAKVTSLIVTMKPGETTGPHRHGVPTYGYILEGQVTVGYGTDGKRTYF